MINVLVDKYKSKILESDCKDFRLKQVYDAVIDIMADETPHLKVCQMKLSASLKIFKIFFQDVMIDNITSNYIYEQKDLANFQFGVLSLMKFLNVLNSLNLIKDLELVKFIQLIDSADMQLNYDKMFEILKDELKDRFVCVNLGKDKRLIAIDVFNLEMIQIIKEYLNSESIGDKHIIFFQEFSASCGKKDLKIDDLNYQTFITQFQYILNKNISKKKLKNILNIVPNFYYYIGLNYRQNIFSDVGLDIHTFRAKSTSCLKAGYEPIIYNPLEDVPIVDKWWLLYGNKNINSSDVNSSFSETFDFSKVKNGIYKKWVKNYIWHHNAAFSTKHSILPKIIEFLNYVWALKTGEELSIYCKKNSSIDISIEEIMVFRLQLQNHQNNSHARNGFIISSFLKFLQQSGLANIPNNYLSVLSTKRSSIENNAKKIDDEHLKRIAQHFKKQAETDDVAKLCYLIFYLLLETELRISNILSLQIDSVKEAHKPNEYVIALIDKTSNKEFIEQPITIYTKRNLDEIIALTNVYRYDEEVSPYIKKYLFIYKNAKGKYVLLTPATFNYQLQKCCEFLGLPVYTASNLRDTHMTKAEEFVIRNQMSDVQQNILSGHKSPTIDNKHYIDTDIRELLESVHGIIIGNVDINGQILTQNNECTKPENEVSNGCGYCSRNACNDFTMLDCMMCKNFVTTIDKLPYFEEQVKVLEHKIKNATIPHDKEDLCNIKRLHLGFIEKILKMKGEIRDV